MTGFSVIILYLNKSPGMCVYLDCRRDDGNGEFANRFLMHRHFFLLVTLARLATLLQNQRLNAFHENRIVESDDLFSLKISFDLFLKIISLGLAHGLAYAHPFTIQK